jgi:hypothetical protein
VAANRARSWLWGKTKAPVHGVHGGFHRGAGDGLLSRGLATGVPSALSGLTTVFGMGTGVALTLESPAKTRWVGGSVARVSPIH